MVLSPLEFARANGWSRLMSQAGTGLQRRLRDRMTARRLGSPGFRAGAAPRLLGLEYMQIGPDLNAGDGLWLEAVHFYLGQRFQPSLTIGPHARLSDNVHIGCLNRVSLGANLLCGGRVLIIDHGHGRYDACEGASDPALPPADRALYSSASVTIGDNVWLGEGVAVLPGAHIGDGCVIGANAVVNGRIPPRTVAVGSPARPVRQWDERVRGWLPIEQEHTPA